MARKNSKAQEVNAQEVQAVAVAETVQEVSTEEVVEMKLQRANKVTINLFNFSI